jgi:hypothetical protein
MGFGERLRDAVYAMAEPFTKMASSEKQLVVFLFAIMLYAWVARSLGIDQRIAFGTAVGSMLAFVTWPFVHRTEP